MTTETTQPDVDLLIVEIRRYLAVVDLFRREGCRPAWQAERQSPTPKPERLRLDRG